MKEEKRDLLSCCGEWALLEAECGVNEIVYLKQVDTLIAKDILSIADEYAFPFNVGGTQEDFCKSAYV